jgi:hypothetical protein
MKDVVIITRRDRGYCTMFSPPSTKFREELGIVLGRPLTREGWGWWSMEKGRIFIATIPQTAVPEEIHKTPLKPKLFRIEVRFRDQFYRVDGYDLKVMAKEFAETILMRGQHAITR